MKSHHLKSDRDLQAYFNQQILRILTKYGKRMEGWDEILNPALPKNIVIQSWRGMKSLEDASRQGYPGGSLNRLLSGPHRVRLETYLVDPIDGDASTLPPRTRESSAAKSVCGPIRMD